MPFSNCMCAGLFACLFTLVAGTSQAFSEAETRQFEGLQRLAASVNRALESNLEIQAAQAAVDAAKARLSGAGLPLNNPQLELEAERTDISTYTLGLRQTIDWHDKQGAFEQSARTELSAAQARIAALCLTKASALLDAIGRIATQHEITTLSKHRSEILERFARLAKQRHAAGDISQAELELAHLSLAEAVMQHAGNGAELIQAGSDYFSLSGRMLTDDIKVPDRLPMRLPNTPDEAVLVRNHPQVQAAYQTAQAARQRIHAVDRERKADPTFGLAAGREDTENRVALSFSIPLQVRNDFRSNLDAARAQALQAEQEAHQVYRNLQAKLDSARERYRLVANAWGHWVSRGRISLQQRLELLETLWRAGEIGTTDYLLQVQQTLDTQIAGVELHGKLWSAWIEWLSASGTLDAWLNTPSKER